MRDVKGKARAPLSTRGEAIREKKEGRRRWSRFILECADLLLARYLLPVLFFLGAVIDRPRE